MKRTLLILLSVVCLKGFSQTSIQLNHITNGNAAMVANEVILNTTTLSATTGNDIDVRNTSGSTKIYNVKRYDVVLNNGAIARYCFASQCYDENTLLSTTSLTLQAGQAASEIQGTFQVITADLDEFNAVGYSHIKYTVINTANANDTIQFSIKYNLGVGVKENNANAFSSALLFPNPATDAAVLTLNSLKATDAKVTIYNALGAIVSEKKVSIAEGKNNITLNVSELNAGVYFAEIKTGNSSATKRLIVK